MNERTVAANKRTCLKNLTHKTKTFNIMKILLYSIKTDFLTYSLFFTPSSAPTYE